MKNKNDLKNKEIKIIKSITKNNGYQKELIDEIIKNLENKKAKLKYENKYLGAISCIGLKKGKIR